MVGLIRQDKDKVTGLDWKMDNFMVRVMVRLMGCHSSVCRRESFKYRKNI